MGDEGQPGAAPPGAPTPSNGTPPARQGGTPALTFTEAATATGRHRNTIRRAFDAGKLPNAYQLEGSGPWLIPVTDLEHAGYQLARPEAAGSTDEAVEEIRRLESEVVELRDRMAEIARRADVAEALALERQARIGDLQLAMRMLGAAPSSGTSETETGVSPIATPKPQPAPKSWFERLIGTPRRRA